MESAVVSANLQPHCILPGCIQGELFISETEQKEKSLYSFSSAVTLK